MYPEQATASTAPTRTSIGGTPLEVGRILREVVRRKRVLAIAALLGAATGVVASRFIDPQYRATAVLVWDDPTTTEPATIERRLHTAVDEIELPVTLERVRTQLAIGLTLEELGARVTAATSQGSDLLHITATGKSGADAATLADEVARAFLAHRTDQVRTLARDRATELRGEIDATTKALELARGERDRFRASHGIVDLPSERTLAVEQRAVLSSDAERARADAGVEQARAGDLGDAAALLPSVSVLSETESRPDVRRLAEAENELAMMRGYLTDDSPRLRSKSAEVDNLRKRASRDDLVVRAERIVGRNPIHDFVKQNEADAAARAVAAQRRHDAYRELADRARVRIDDLNKLEGEAAELDGKVTSLEARLSQLRRDQQAALERAQVGGADLHVVAPASIPPHPFKSKRRTVAIAMPAALFALAIVAIALRALRGLRIATPRELAYWTGAPVVAACERLDDSTELEAVARELGAIVDGHGTTLVLAASDRERDGVRALTACLETGVPSRDVESWTHDTDQGLRRRARAAARVLVVVAARRYPPWALRRLTARLGTKRIAIVAVDVGTELALMVDQVGDASALA